MSDDGFVFTYLVETDTEHVAEDGLTGKESIASLLDIVGMGIVIHLVGNLIHTR